MARTSLRKKIEGMNEGDVLKVPKDYEETTIRNGASRVGSAMGRSYSVTKDVKTKTFTITRLS